MVVDHGAVADLVDHAVAHDRNPVGHGQRLALVVGDVDEGDADPSLNGAQLGAHVLAQFQVERRERLVEQQHLGLDGERARDGDALSLASRELVHHLFALAGQGDQLEKFVGAFAPYGLAGAAHLERKRDVLPNRHQGEQRQVLENERGGPQVRADAGHVLALDADVALGRLQEPGDGPQ